MQNDEKIVFPALAIDKTHFDKIDFRYLFGDKRLIDVAYKDTLIIDSESRCFDCSGVEQAGGFSLYYSIKYVGLMVRLRPVLKRPVFYLSLEEVKEKLIAILRKYPKEFRSWGSSERLITEIRNAQNLKEIMKLF